MKQVAKLNERMRAYEDINKCILMPKQPIIARLWIKNYSIHDTEKFYQTVLAVMQEVPQIEFSYCHSGEISFFLKDYKTKQQEQYFKGNLHNILASLLSKVTLNFNRGLIEMREFKIKVFSLPIHETVNYFICQQREGIKKNIVAVAKAEHIEIKDKTTSELTEELKSKNFDWDQFHTHVKFGACFLRKEIELPLPDLKDEVIDELKEEPKETFKRTKPMIDSVTPIFSEEKTYLEKLVYSQEENKVVQLEFNF